MLAKENSLREEIIEIGKKLYDRKLVVARSGNLSICLDENNILVTATGSSLGHLSSENVIKVDIRAEVDIKKERVTSEYPLHSLIYKNFPHKTVIHCHPSLTNAYFAVNDDLKAFTFETRLYLPDIPVVPQDTPTVTKPEAVIEALKKSNLIVLKNHGVVACGNNFLDAFFLVEALEEAVKTLAVARLFKKDILDNLDNALKRDLG